MSVPKYFSQPSAIRRPNSGRPGMTTGAATLSRSLSTTSVGEPLIDEDDDYEEYIPVAKRSAMEAQKLLQRRGQLLSAASGSVGDSDDPALVRASSSGAAPALAPAEVKPSLLVKATQMKRELPEVSPTEQLVMLEKEMIEHLSDRKTLMSVRELAKDTTFTDPTPTGWKPPLAIRRMPGQQADHIVVATDGTFDIF